MHYPHRTVVGIGFFLLAAVFIKCLHYKLLITTFSLQIQSTQLSIQDLFGLWLYCITYGATCQLAVCAASRSLGVFYFKLGCDTTRTWPCDVRGRPRSRARVALPGPQVGATDGLLVWQRAPRCAQLWQQPLPSLPAEPVTARAEQAHPG